MTSKSEIEASCAINQAIAQKDITPIVNLSHGSRLWVKGWSHSRVDTIIHYLIEAKSDEMVCIFVLGLLGNGAIDSIAASRELFEHCGTFAATPAEFAHMIALARSRVV